MKLHSRIFLGILSLSVAPASAFADTFTVTNTLDSGAGSLRAAINNANAHPNSSAKQPDVIEFHIHGGGVHRIAPLTDLAVISDPVVIDGYSQPGASPNTQAKADDAVLLIELNGGKTKSVGEGLSLKASGTVRGLVINGWQQWAITVNNGATGAVVIEGNFVGTDASGTSASANLQGLVLQNSSDVTIGSTTPAARNIVSGNSAGGAGIAIASYSSVATVQGNFIGVDASGEVALPNDIGLTIDCATSSTVVGGAAPGAGNVISGNGEAIFTQNGGTAAGATEIAANRIGVAAATLDPVPNGVGLHLDSTQAASSKIRVGLVQQGTTTARVPNVIAHNSGAGVLVNTGGVTITANHIFANGGLGIDLSNDSGVTPNDQGDGDTGANSLQNFPALGSATTYHGHITLLGFLDSKPNRTYRLEFFGNPKRDASRHGETRWFFGASDVTTDSNGQASFNFTFPNHHPAAKWATASATNPDGETSEFGVDRQIFEQPPPPAEPTLQTPAP